MNIDAFRSLVGREGFERDVEDRFLALKRDVSSGRILSAEDYSEAASSVREKYRLSVAASARRAEIVANPVPSCKMAEGSRSMRDSSPLRDPVFSRVASNNSARYASFLAEGRRRRNSLPPLSSSSPLP